MNDKLIYKRETGYENPNSALNRKIFDFCEGYKDFLDKARTERCFVKESIRVLEENGYREYKREAPLSAGDKIYFNNRGKSLIAAEIGSESISNGVNLIGAHIDSPRLDLKPIPLFESSNLLYIKTHYYGGIKKYQWPIIPLALIGTCVLKTGKAIDISIGLNEDEPVFVISDILPHLGNSQMKKNATDIVEGEQLNALGASMPFYNDEEKEKIKLNFLNILNKKYKITEEDLISSELTLVPALKPRDVGLDRSMISAYGQDDKVCAYTTLKALLNSESGKKTKIMLLSDKEEVGSMGNTGMESNFFVFVMEELCEKQNAKLRDALTSTVCLSADVCAAYDPNFADVFEKNNSTYFNEGIAIMKYTGARGKSGSSDASAELIAKVRKIFDKGNVKWQIGELGKVDAGGGGTIAQIVANLGCDVIDCGVPLLSMHSPYEVSSKLDVYMAYKAYKVFFESN